MVPPSFSLVIRLDFYHALRLRVGLLDDGRGLLGSGMKLGNGFISPPSEMPSDPKGCFATLSEEKARRAVWSKFLRNIFLIIR